MSKKNIRKYNRSGNNECPICNQRVKLVCHHIHGRKIYRWNEPWNCVWVCSICHDEIHLKNIFILGWHNINGKREILFRYKNEDILEDYSDIIPPSY